MKKQIKIKTPYGDKNWEYIKKLIDEDSRKEDYIIPNYFDKDDVAEVVGEDEISREEFINFQVWLEDSALADDISDLIRNYWTSFKNKDED